MKYLFFLLCLPLSASILDFTDSEISYLPSKLPGIDAIFVIQLQQSPAKPKIYDALIDNGLKVTLFDRFKNIDEKVLKKYCSNTISPHLLSQTLSHLSIYKYCLQQKIKTALIIEDNQEIIGPLNHLSKSLRQLGKWDIFFTDRDYRDPTSGKYIIPNLLEYPIVKRKVNENFSLINIRYGCSSYIISRSGMRKILSTMKIGWIDLPFDQSLLKVPNLKLFGSNRDIISNAVTQPEKIHENRNPTYKAGSSLTINPISLITYDRLDILAKYIFAKYTLNKYNTNFHKSLYKKHLAKKNHFFDTNPLKIGYDTFESSFLALLESVQLNGFDTRYPIPVNCYGSPTNGAHRTAACLLLNVPVRAYVEDRYDSPSITSKACRNKYQFDEDLLDQLVLEYTKLKNCSITFIEQKNQLKSIEKQYTVVHTKKIELTENGIRELERLFGKRPKRQVVVVLVDGEVQDPTLPWKNHDMAREIATTVFNRNSLNFINMRKACHFPRFEAHMKSVARYLKDRNIEAENICVDTGSVLAALGIRDCDDIDILHRGKLKNAAKYGIDSHNSYLKYHAVNLDEILFNPECHFYYRGVKFITPQLLMKMKRNRSAIKDMIDYRLIERFIANPAQ
ncbi:MAG: glycosyltransferase family 25 protein [Simkaniaceae bacterium]|nr:glycosyltransferase family 25 protein [Simkaniaceae bacterium]